MDRLSNAVNSLEACRAVLAQIGEHDAALALRGIEVHNASDALMAIYALQDINTESDEAHAACTDAISALKFVAEKPYVNLCAVA